MCTELNHRLIRRAFFLSSVRSQKSCHRNGGRNVKESMNDGRACGREVAEWGWVCFFDDEGNTQNIFIAEFTDTPSPGVDG